MVQRILHQSDLDDLEELLPPLPPADRRVDDADEFQRLLERLDSNVLRQILILARDGHTVAEIADRLGVARKTVERKVKRIRLVMHECGYFS